MPVQGLLYLWLNLSSSHSSLIIFCGQYKPWSSSLRSCLCPVTSSLLLMSTYPSHSLSALFWKTSNVVLFVWQDRPSTNPNTKTGKGLQFCTFSASFTTSYSEGRVGFRSRQVGPIHYACVRLTVVCWQKSLLSRGRLLSVPRKTAVGQTVSCLLYRVPERSIFIA